MDKKTLAAVVRKMESKEQLLDMLNRMKRDEMTEVGRPGNFYPFTMQQLNFYCNPRHAHRYKQFRIRKKTGGVRQISAPKTQTFKLLLRYVNKILASAYTPSDYAMGFTEGRSVVTNANRHKGQNYVFNVDLKDFFPSIDQARVWKRLQLEPFCFSRPIANVLAGLCAMKQEAADGSVRFVLPQGAPTSPIITNMICDTLDRRLAGLAKRFGLHYSRYADDITFSSMHNVYQEAGDFRKELKHIVEGQGFAMNESKTRLQKTGSRQEVTGIIVRRKINVTQKYVRDIRNILYIWDRYGYSAAFNKFIPKYRNEKAHVKKRSWDMVNVLNGKLMYLKMVKGESDSVYVRLKAKFNQLAQQYHVAYYTSANNVAFLETTPVLAFEKKNSTEITIATSNSHHRYAHFMLAGKKRLASVHKSVSAEEEKQKECLAITLCRDAKGNQFWLVHHKIEMFELSDTSTDINELNRMLDALLGNVYE